MKFKHKNPLVGSTISLVTQLLVVFVYWRAARLWTRLGSTVFLGKKHRIHRWTSIHLQDVLKSGQHFAARMKRLLAKRHALQDELLETWLGTLKWFCMSKLHIIYIKWILYVFEIYVHTTVTIVLLPLCFWNQGYPACTSRFRAGIIPNLIDTTRLRLPHCSGRKGKVFCSSLFSRDYLRNIYIYIESTLGIPIN